MSQLLPVISNALKKIETMLAIIAGTALIATMVLIVIDVVMRYYFNQPLTWWYDILTNYVMIAIFYLAFSDALRRREHLNIDLLQNRIPKNWAGPLFAAIYIFIAPLMVYIGFLGLKSAISSYQNKEVLAGLIAWPTWPTKTIAGIAFLILGLRTFLTLADPASHESDQDIIAS